MALRGGLAAQRLPDVRRDRRERRARARGCVAASSGRWPVDPGRRQPAVRLQLRVALPVDARPLAVELARRELAGVARLVEAPDQAVDPAEAERLVERVQVGDRGLAGVALV